MKVTMLRNPGTAWSCGLTEGQTGTVDAVTGKRLVDAGIAVEIVDPVSKVEAVPPKPVITEAAKPTIADSAKSKLAAKVDTPESKTSSQRRGGKFYVNKE